MEKWSISPFRISPPSVPGWGVGPQNYKLYKMLEYKWPTRAYPLQIPTKFSGPVGSSVANNLAGSVTELQRYLDVISGCVFLPKFSSLHCGKTVHWIGKKVLRFKTDTELCYHAEYDGAWTLRAAGDEKFDVLCFTSRMSTGHMPVFGLLRCHF